MSGKEKEYHYKPRILFVSHSGEFYGAERSLLTLVRGLQRLDRYEILVIIPEEGPLSSALYDEDIPFRVIPYMRWIGFRYHTVARYYRRIRNRLLLGRLVREAERWMPDVIYTNTIATPVGAMVAGKLSPKPLHIWHARELPGDRSTGFGLFDYGTGKSLRLMAGTSDCFICNSRFLHDQLVPQLQRAGGSAREFRTEIVYNGLELEEDNAGRSDQVTDGSAGPSDQVADGSADPSDQRSDSNVNPSGQRADSNANSSGQRAGSNANPSDQRADSNANPSGQLGRPGGKADTPIRMIMAGGISRVKHYSEAVAAAKILDAAEVTLQLDIYGSGDDEEMRRLVKEIEGAGLEKKVHLMGYRSDLGTEYARSDMLLITSRMETFGRVAVEAMLAGCPVVSSDAGALPEIVLDGETGLLYRSGDPDHLARQIRRIAGDPALRKSISDRARDYAENRFSAERFVTDIDRILRDLTAGFKKPETD